jgi:hypothetical protein
MRIVRFTIAMVFGMVVFPFGATPAIAAAPSNDTFAGAAPAALGSSLELVTTDATTDADDAQLNTNCGAPATDASVWYSVAGTDAGVIVDVSQSSYSAGVLVGVGTQGNLEIVACGPGAVAFFAASGTTYYVLAIDDQADGGGNGGTLRISFSAAPQPPTVEISVDRVGRFDSRSGAITLTGTYACTNADFIDVLVQARQNAGRFSILGSGEVFDVGTCDGATRAWTAQVFSANGKFKGGKAITVATAFACGSFQCSDGFVEQTVLLRGK